MSYKSLLGANEYNNEDIYWPHLSGFNFRKDELRKTVVLFQYYSSCSGSGPLSNGKAYVKVINLLYIL